MKQSIRLHRDDLETILKHVDRFNPADDMKLAAGYVTINSESVGGIGDIIDIDIPMDMNGVYGKFNINIVDESSW
jgi:hypothetical protein